MYNFKEEKYQLTSKKPKNKSWEIKVGHKSTKQSPKHFRKRYIGKASAL